MKKKTSAQSPTTEKELPPDDFELEDPPLSKSPTLSQTYKKFQAEVPQQSTVRRDSAPDNQGIYHTVISKNALTKNKHNVNLHSFDIKSPNGIL